MITHPILTKLANHGIRMGIDSLRDFLFHVGISADHFPFVLHVGGTNGKGSVCRMLESIYQEAGYKVGVYTSPHLQHVNERVRVNGQDISDGDLSRLLTDTQTKSALWAIQEGLAEEAPLTYFEMMTAVAIQYFEEQSVDVVILEVGLGGRLDATNVLNSSASCIVSIGLDHTEVLGPDLVSIATEKAGIIKPNQSVVLGMMDESALRALRYIANEMGARTHQLGQGFYFSDTADGFHFQTDNFRLEGVQVGLVGEHQRHNAALALQLIHTQQGRKPVTVSDMLRGLSKVQHPGRLEWVGNSLLLDAAHNPAGAEKLAQYIQTIRNGDSRPVTLLLGCSTEKDIRSIAVILSASVDRIFATYCRHPRAKTSTEIVKELRLDTPVFDMGAIEEALQHCRWGEELVVVAGSIFLVGAVKSLLNEDSDFPTKSVLLEVLSNSGHSS